MKTKTTTMTMTTATTVSVRLMMILNVESWILIINFYKNLRMMMVKPTKLMFIVVCWWWLWWLWWRRQRLTPCRQYFISIPIHSFYSNSIFLPISSLLPPALSCRSHSQSCSCQINIFLFEDINFCIINHFSTNLLPNTPTPNILIHILANCMKSIKFNRHLISTSITSSRINNNNRA